MSCATCEATLPIARFASLTDTRVTQDATATWSTLRELLMRSSERAEKGGPLWSPVTYKPGATTRALTGIESVHAFVADIDEGAAPKVIEAHLKKCGLEFVIHSTHSSTATAPKFRVVVPLAAPVAAASWSSVWPSLNRELVLSHSDPATKDAARAFYLPTHPTGSTPFAHAGHGKPAVVPEVGALSRSADRSQFPAQDAELVRGTSELLSRVEGQSPDGPVFRRILETTRGEPRSHETNLALCGELHRAGATYVQAARFLDWPESNVASTMRGFARKGVYSIPLRKLAQDDPLVSDALEAMRARRDVPSPNPWEGRAGWEDEPLLPIQHLDGEGSEFDLAAEDDDAGEPGRPVEPAYVLYNRLISSYNFRPFRTSDGGTRVAIPSDHGLDVLCPVAEDFVDRIGYELFSTRGHRIPFKQLRLVSKTLASRALARSLPRARIVDLSLRVAPAGRLSSRIDMADEGRRCIAVSPEGWKIEEIGCPIFDMRSHMLPLPEPIRVASVDGDWTRVSRLWRFIPLPNAGLSGNQRLLALADLVQFVLSPRSPKVVKIMCKEEGTGKSTQMGYYGSILDPSTVPHMKPPAPKDDEDAINIAMNRAVVNFDNVSSIPLELSDYVCRIASGTGLVKRAKYTDRDELVVTVWRSVLVNGITAVPKYPDLLRRCLFFNPARVTPQPKEVLHEDWERAHPEILGGLLDLCVLTARALRDSQIGTHPSTMADYVRIGRAVAIACGLGQEAFDAAWEINTSSQDDAASVDPLLISLYDFFIERGTKPARAEDIAIWVMQTRGSLFPKGVTGQTVGNAIARSRQVLARRGIRIGHQKEHGGVPVWYQLAPGEVDPEDQIPEITNSGSPGSPGSPPTSPSYSQRQDDRGGLLSLEPDRGSPAAPVGSPGSPTGSPPPSGSTQAPPRLPPSRPSENNTPGEPGDPLSLEKGAEGGGAAVNGPKDGARDWDAIQAVVRSELLLWQENGARYEAASEEDKSLIQAQTHYSRVGPYIDYNGQEVTIRRTGDVVWRPGDPIEYRPTNPTGSPYNKPHTKRSW